MNNESKFILFAVLLAFIWSLYYAGGSDFVVKTLARHTRILQKGMLSQTSFRGYYVLPSDEDLFTPIGNKSYVVKLTYEGALFGKHEWGHQPTILKCHVTNSTSTVTVYVKQEPPSILQTQTHRYRHLKLWHTFDKLGRSGSMWKLPIKPHEVFAFETQEPPVHNPEWLNQEHAGAFDLEISYRPQAMYKKFYHAPLTEWLQTLQAPLSVPWAKKNVILSAAVSNCEDHNGRSFLIEALQRHLGDDFVSIGGCHPSGPVDHPGKKDDGGTDFDVLVAASYFVLAVENSNCEQYVTEKLNRFGLGTIPIVFDAPQSLADGPDDTLIPGYHRFMPPGTYINVADFESTKSLVNHLTKIANNQTLYNSYLWTRNASTEEILARWPEHRNFDFRGLDAASVANGEALNTEQLQVCAMAKASIKRIGGGKGPRVEPDLSCLPSRLLCNFIPDDPNCKIGERKRAYVRSY
eukprot:m.136842 g.136842  ORF g.136842 m.136842 type:complete len:464 (+) comp29886_c0_seq1:90-1481(+)